MTLEESLGSLEESLRSFQGVVATRPPLFSNEGQQTPAPGPKILNNLAANLATTPKWTSDSLITAFINLGHRKSIQNSNFH